MAEYIDRKSIRYEQWAVGPLNKPLMVVRKKTIDNIPAADVAQVVHCCDCKHLSVYNTKDCYAWCRKIGFTFLPFETDTRTHFCAFGERMDGDG